MAYIGNSPGLTKRQLFTYIATEGQTVFSGTDSKSLTLNYTPGLINVYVNGYLILQTDYIATNGSTITLSTGLNDADEVVIDAYGAFSLADTLSKSQNLADGNAPLMRKSLAVPRAEAALYTGMVTNPHFKVNQSGVTTGAGANNITIYLADEYTVSKANVGVLTANYLTGQNSAFSGFKGLAYSLQAKATTATSTYTSGTYMSPLSFFIEADKMTKLAWGTSEARSVVLVFVIKASIAGTYTASFRNAAFDRTIVKTFTIAAGEVNTAKLVMLTFPGPTTGTWNTFGTDFGVVVSIGSVASTTNQVSVLDAWTSGSGFSHASATNWAGTTNATIDFSYVDLFAEGTLPFTSVSDTDILNTICLMQRPLQTEIDLCSRYWQSGTIAMWRGTTTTGVTNGQVSVQLPITMRANPTITATHQTSNAFDTNSPTVVGSTTKEFSLSKLATGSTADSYWVATWTASARFG